MKVRTNVKAGGGGFQRCERLSRTAKTSGLKVRTNVKAGGGCFNRCEKLSREG